MTMAMKLPGPGLHLAWPLSRVMTRAQQDTMTKVLIRRGEFCTNDDLTEHRVAEIEREAFIASSGSRLSPAMLVRQGLSLRMQLLSEKAQRTHRSLLRGPKIPEQYARGMTLQQLSKRYDVAPVALFRAVLAHRIQVEKPDLKLRWVKQAVKSLLRQGKTGDMLTLTARDADELAWAKSVDGQ